MSITTVHREVPGVNPDMKTGCSDRFNVFTLSLSTHIGTLRRVPAKGHDFSVDILPNSPLLITLRQRSFITHPVEKASFNK